AGRGGPGRPPPAAGAGGARRGTPSARRADHADPHHRRGAPPLLRPEVPAAPGAGARPAPAARAGPAGAGGPRRDGPADAPADRWPRPPLRRAGRRRAGRQPQPGRPAAAEGFRGQDPPAVPGARVDHAVLEGPLASGRPLGQPVSVPTKVLVVGTGFAGLGMAVRLKQAGIEDFVVLERAGEVGGTWRDNTYPGATCDVPSHLYSFSFAPNPGWSRSFSPQAEIQAYLERVAGDFGVRPHVRFHHEMHSAAWDEARRRWRVETTGGEFEAAVLVSGTGALSDPRIPSLPGLDRFEGTVFHSARWRHDHDLGGRRVAVVGTGASAIQFVPRIQPEVGHLTVFQRTPPWILPRWERPFRPAEQWVFRHLPAVQRLARAGIYWGREQMVAGFVVAPGLMRAAERLARRHLERSVPDPRLRARLTPDYRIGCKRI